ncbi:hypothetical protein DPMN_055167 [Dreissena polymorpha]|uniref:Uncharacterized protein n=1 Tax=Dreissena polymorpha TaxID=45954 RepID=A0A9D4CS61_DREPO|nr:hypothetical protein DPMN_055167 [Dreissena polymorpha]
MPRPSLYLKETNRRCQTVTQTVGAPAGDSKTVYDVGKTSGRRQENRTRCQVPDNIHDRRGTSRKILDSLRRCQDRPGTCIRLPDGVKLSLTPSRHLHETPIQSATVRRPSGHLHEIPKQSSTELETVWHCNRLSGSLLKLPRRFWHVVECI